MLVSVSIVPEVVHGKELRKVNSGESIEEHENASEKDRLDKLGKDIRLAVIMLSTESLYIELVVSSEDTSTSSLLSHWRDFSASSTCPEYTR